VIKKKSRNHRGFTLIEIIAVLVILGILAGIAIPMYLNMQTDAKNRAVEGAVAALIGSASMDYQQALMNGTSSATSFIPVGSHTVGDFSGSISAGTNGLYEAEVTGGPDSNYMSGVSDTYKKKTFRLF
jgi:prepilin-type N-terminal cleavage/methylation domain-containing protein